MQAIPLQRDCRSVGVREAIIGSNAGHTTLLPYLLRLVLSRGEGWSSHSHRPGLNGNTLIVDTPHLPPASLWGDGPSPFPTTPHSVSSTVWWHGAGKSGWHSSCCERSRRGRIRCSSRGKITPSCLNMKRLPPETYTVGLRLRLRLSWRAGASASSPSDAVPECHSALKDKKQHCSRYRYRYPRTRVAFMILPVFSPDDTYAHHHLLPKL